ncbi:MAG: hypothetical protein PHR87_04895 [Sulfurospirillaceae bacterium]|nr:hypothetical protein [Sulfurospirillaceae bacterium]
MGIHVNPLSFQHHTALEKRTLQTHYSARDLENLRTKETEVSIEGDIFTYSGVSFKPMSQDELLKEKIDINALNLTSETTSAKPIDDRVIIAFRDPNEPKKIIAYKLDKNIVDDLKKSFSADNFFERKDGILRLNSKAEEYIAGWVSDIKENRGYEKADKNGNGIIDKGEQDDLNIGFDRQSDYDYLGEKIVAARTSVGKRNYLKYSDTADSHKAGDVLSNQALKFRNTIEKELAHTIEMDQDKDGTITLKEGLVDFTPPKKSVENFLVEKMKSFHDEWVIQSNIVLDQYHIATNNVPITAIITQQDMDEALKQFNEDAKQLHEDNRIKMKIHKKPAL